MVDKYIQPYFDKTEEIILYHGDCLEGVKPIPNGEVQLIITSPPYNIGKEYEEKSSLDAYLKSFDPIFSELCRVLAPQGSLCWQVGNYISEGEVIPLDILFYPILKRHGLKLRNRIIWHYGHGLHCSKRFSGRYETLLWLTKTDSFVFNLDPVRIPSKYPGKRHFKGPRKGQPSGNPLGKNPSDVWDFIQQDWEAGIWDIPNVKNNHPEKTHHPCQFPIELVQRCVLALTNEGDLVLDPFCGSGSSMIGAVMHCRRAMGCEKEIDYIRLTKNRIISLFEGSLGYRELGKPIFQPSGKQKITQPPHEWRGQNG